ncbi:uncharacterized protein LOC120337857 [Styela clava]
MAVAIGSIGDFIEDQKNWPTYVERLEQFMIANEIADGKKVSVYLSVIGRKTFMLVRDLVAPEKPATKTFADLCEVLKDHLSPEPLVQTERFRFHQRSQKHGESVLAFYADLKRLSTTCEFGAELGHTLRDKFVSGLKCSHTQNRLITEKNLTHKKALQVAVEVEIAAKDTKVLQGKNTANYESENAHYVKRDAARKCYRCGKIEHHPDKCWFKEKYCLNCNKRGHTKFVCRSKPHHRRSTQPRLGRQQNCTREVEKSVAADKVASKFLSNIQVAKVNENEVSVHATDIIWIPVKIAGKVMEMDTGAAVSIISNKDYQKHFKNEKLTPTAIKMKTYTGEPLKPLGLLPVEV